MTTIEVAEASDGVAHTITIYQKGTTTGENLSSYNAASLIVTSPDFKTVHMTKTITLTTAAADTLPTIPLGERDLRLKAQVKVTGTNLKDITEIFDFIIIKSNISVI